MMQALKGSLNTCKPTASIFRLLRLVCFGRCWLQAAIELPEIFESRDHECDGIGRSGSLTFMIPDEAKAATSVCATLSHGR